jgi:type IV secretion system protein TrbE
MLNLAEYRKKPQSLADFLPWAALVAEGVVLNKDGSLQRTARFRGPDLDSATPAELVGTTARLNNALRRLGSGWAIFVEASRNVAQHYPQSAFPDPISALVDAERKAQFEEEGAHFESTYYLTFVFLPPPEEAARAEAWLYEGRSPHGSIEGHDVLRGFIDRTDRVLQLVEGFVPEALWLSNEGTLTYLHSCISTRRHRVRLPEVPMYLDAILVDEALTGGLEPRLGRAHLRTLTVMGFPSATHPGILEDLNRLAFPYRWSTRAIALDKADAARVLTRIRRQWFAKRKSIMAILKEVMTNEPAALLDTDAHNKAMDADTALQELGSDLIGQAYVTATVTVWDEDARERQRGRGLARKPARPRLCQCPPAADLDPQSRAHDSAVRRLGGTGTQRASGRATAPVRQDRRCDTVPAVTPCRRRRPHARDRADRRRQERALGADRTAVSALSRLAGLRFRFRGLDPCGRAGDGRRLA